MDVHPIKIDTNRFWPIPNSRKWDMQKSYVLHHRDLTLRISKWDPSFKQFLAVAVVIVVKKRKCTTQLESLSPMGYVSPHPHPLIVPQSHCGSPPQAATCAVGRGHPSCFPLNPGGWSWEYPNRPWLSIETTMVTCGSLILRNPLICL